MEENLKNRMDPLELLALAGSLNSITDLDFLLKKIGDAASQLLDCEASSIMLLDDSKKFLYFKLATGAKGSVMKRMTIPVGNGIAGWVAEHKEVVVVNDTKTDSRFAQNFDRESGFKTRQLIAIPMMSKGELIGVVEVLNRRTDEPFGKQDVDILLSLANMASVAIQNTRLIQDQKNFFSHVLELLVAAIETTRPSMDSHPNNAAYLSCAIAKRMGVQDPEYRYLYYAGLLHDIGYVGLRNKRLMTESGFNTFSPDEQHLLMSTKMLEGINIFHGAMPMIKNHHENYDGTGPNKLSGQDIPLGARILRLVEAMEELRMTTGLQGEDLRQHAIGEARNGAGKMFDPAVVEAFIDILREDSRVWSL